MKQPIETAPKDGTWILLFGGLADGEDFPGTGTPRPVVAKWVTNAYNSGVGGWAYAYWDSGWRSCYENPTHWMELPE